MSPPRRPATSIARFAARAWCACLLLLGCGDDGAVSDGGLDGGSDADLVATPPRIPWLAEEVPPVGLTPCPPGWREVTGGAVTECAPYPEGGPATCDPGEAHFPGEPGCRPVGAACPAGDYATPLPTAGAIVYVNATAAPGGDGSRSTPYPDLSSVPWISLAAGTTIAVAKGTYEGVLPLRAGVTVVGACARDTTITGLDGPVQTVVTVTTRGAPAAVRDLTIASPHQLAVVAQGERELSLSGVIIDGSHFIAVSAVEAGASVRLEDCVVRNTRPGASDDALGRGFDAALGGRIEARRVVLSQNREIAVNASGDDSTVVLEDVVIRDTMPQLRDGALGRALNVQGGAHLEASRVLAADNVDLGIRVGDPGTTADLTDVVVRGTESDESTGVGGRGVSVSAGATLTGTRVVIARNREIGVYADGAGTTISLEDAVIRDTTPQRYRDEAGRNINVQGGAHFVGTRLLATASYETGAYIADEGTTATLTDVVIQDTETALGTGAGGRGLSLQGGARLEGTRLVVARSYDVGIFVAEAETVAVLTDTVVRRTQRRGGGRGGSAVHVQTAARLDAQRIEIDGAEMAGLTASAGATATVSDARITQIFPPPCSASNCADISFGYGVNCIGSTLGMRRFEVLGVALCGVFVSKSELVDTATAMDLEGGVIADAAIGACVQVEGYDFDRLANDVYYRDNGTNLDTTMLPVPGLPDPL